MFHLFMYYIHTDEKYIKGLAGNLIQPRPARGRPAQRRHPPPQDREQEGLCRKDETRGPEE